MRHVSRRDAIALGAGGAALAVVGWPGLGLADAKMAAEEIAKFTGGKAAEKGKISIELPEIAENGNTVPVSVSVESAMSGDDMVQSVIILAEGNPNPAVATFNFTAMSGAAEATTRMRLAKTQNVIAVARMADGSVYMDKKEVKVTIGGCGG